MKTPIKRNYRYLLKCVLPVFALAGAMIGCEKESSNPYAGPIDPVKVLRFGEYWGYDSILQYNNVMKYARDPRIEKIIYFMDSINDNNNYITYSSQSISDVIRNTLQQWLDYTPKATGAGTFVFSSGAILPQDSLWFIQNGWKIKLWSR